VGWYDVFSGFYDRSLEPLYRAQRESAAEALRIEPRSIVLDLPCGTGQSFDAIAARLGKEGAIVAVDVSAGMLARARSRADRLGLTNVTTLASDVHAIDRASIAQALGRPAGDGAVIDRLHVFLGLTAFPRYEEAFARLWDLLAPGGRCAIVDVHADPIGFQGRMVNLVARADITRRWWEPLERVASEYARIDLPSRPEHGGRISLATGAKAR
jgi:ubiquinone/menaquinone biosynthesis C-methylase UbiE